MDGKRLLFESHKRGEVRRGEEGFSSGGRNTFGSLGDHIRLESEPSSELLLGELGDDRLGEEGVKRRANLLGSSRSSNVSTTPCCFSM
jgi:hypothetical protein